MQTIQNSRFKISVREKGAELCSIFSKQSGKEYMWQADPNVWGSHAPVLFPVIGALKDGCFLYKGKSYSVPKHGLIRNHEGLNVRTISEDCIEGSLKYTDDSLKNYPFQFEFFIRYRLMDHTIRVEHQVINHSKDEPLFFSVGGHPAFVCPVEEGESYEDYYLLFEHSENFNSWNVLPDGLIGPDQFCLATNTDRIPLTKQLFDKDALVFKDLKSKKVSLKNKSETVNVTVEFAGFPYLGIWAKPGGHFVCIEPWQGISDSFDTDRNFETKEGIVRLEPKSFSPVYCYSISIVE